jgi:hypothetical protein
VIECDLVLDRIGSCPRSSAILSVIDFDLVLDRSVFCMVGAGMMVELITLALLVRVIGGKLQTIGICLRAFLWELSLLLRGCGLGLEGGLRQQGAVGEVIGHRGAETPRTEGARDWGGLARSVAGRDFLNYSSP